MKSATAPRYHNNPQTGGIHKGDLADCADTDCAAMHAFQQKAEAAARTSPIPLEAAVRRARARRDAQDRAAAYREAADLIEADGTCTTPAHTEHYAALLRDKADEIDLAA